MSAEMPEPVAWFSAWDTVVADAFSWMRDEHCNEPLYTADQMRAYALEATRQAMERAAQLVENYDTCGDHTQGWQDTFAARIRALSDMPAQEPQP